jgi:release factor glutamine methyltransferase
MPESAHAIQSYERSLERSRLSLTRPDRPRTFTLCGREWDLFDEVFAPVFSPSTTICLDFLGLGSDTAPSGGTTAGRSFLEIGCGSGVVAVQAALLGSEQVVALDVNPRAVENTAANAARHGVADRVRVLTSDLFSALDDTERFDTIIWSSNYVRGPEDYEYRSAHERAYVDAGYRAHRRYLEEAPLRTTESGSALLHFSSRGDVAELHRIADECGRELRVLASRHVRENEYDDDLVEHTLLQIVPAGR